MIKNVSSYGTVWQLFIEKLNRFLNLEALKLISLAFLWLQDHAHEKERKISCRMVLRIPSGMIWSPSYDRFCVFIYFSPYFPDIFLHFPFNFPYNPSIWTYCHLGDINSQIVSNSYLYKWLGARDAVLGMALSKVVKLSFSQLFP